MSGVLWSIETEQALLGALFAKPEQLDDVAGFLGAEHFYEPLHREIYAVIRRLAHEGRLFNPITMAPFFEHAEPVGQLTVAQYMGKMLASVTSLIHTREYGRLIKEFAERRGLAAAGLRLQQLAGDHSVSAAQAASEAAQELDTIMAASRPNCLSWLTAEATAQKLLDDLDNGLIEKPLSTGLKDFDRITGGFRRQEYLILAGRPSMGKSAVGISMALAPARAGNGVLFFSLEMAKKAVAARLLSDMVWNRDTPIEYTDTLKGRMRDQHDKKRLQAAARQLAGLPLIIEDQPGLTLAEIGARSRHHAAWLERTGKSLDVIVVDHLDKIKASSRYAGNLVAETGEKSQALAGLAKGLNVTVLALHQLNRAVEGREDKRPQLSDLRNSGDIEQDADGVTFVYRPAYYLERDKFDDRDLEAKRKKKLGEQRHDLELIVAKNRNGPITTIELYCDIASNVIRDKST